MEMMDNNNNWNWENDPIDNPDAIVLDKFFSSPVYDTIVREATLGDGDSADLLEQINTHLESAAFHMSNESPRSRIDYELRSMAELVRDFIEE